MKRIFLLFLIIPFLSFCKKEKELLTEDIMGKITVYNEDLTSPPDRSGVLIRLFLGGIQIDSTMTSTTGLYRFKDKPYGKYEIQLIRENYVQQIDDYTIYHVGGFSPTLRDASIYQVPDYTLTIDSLKLLTGEYPLIKVYLKVNGDTLIPFSDIPLIGYIGSSPVVSKDNYSFIVTGHVMDHPWYPPYAAHGEAYEFTGNLAASGTYYTRFYLLAFGQNSYPTNTKALGKPSNVLRFSLN